MKGLQMILTIKKNKIVFNNLKIIFNTRFSWMMIVWVQLFVDRALRQDNPLSMYFLFFYVLIRI